MKKKCQVCGKRFMPDKETVYQVFEPKTALKAMTEVGHTYDAVDCPRCGCQQVLKIRMPILAERENENEIESDA